MSELIEDNVKESGSTNQEGKFRFLQLKDESPSEISTYAGHYQDATQPTDKPTLSSYFARETSVEDPFDSVFHANPSDVDNLVSFSKYCQ